MTPRNPVTNNHLVALGGITLEYARLEQFISHFIWALVAKDARIGQTITAPMTFRGRITLLRSLFHMLPARGVKADVATLDALITKAEKAVEKRNNIVHALIWHADAQGDLAFTMLKKNAKGDARWVAASASVPDLNAVAADIYEALVGISDFMGKHFGGNTYPPRGGKGTLYAQPKKKRKD